METKKRKQAFNPYLPGYEYVPDGEPHVFGDRIYVYGSHDRFNGEDFCLNDYVCWSAPVQDLADWRYEGVIYRKIQDPRTPDPQNHRLFAPDVQQGADGRFYLYYAFDFTGTIGVAVCSTPAGSYEYYGHVHYKDGTVFGEKEDDFFQYDPGVLADPTGGVYLYTGFCPSGELQKRFHLPKPAAAGAMVTELEPDMVTIKREPALLIPGPAISEKTGFEGHAFFEASSMRMAHGRYYFIYSSEKGHELCYAVSDRPNSGFIYGGTLLSNGDIGYHGRTEPLNYTGTNHGSMEKIEDRWYIFYHRQTNGTPYSRQGCAEELTFLPDGSIPQAELTSCGLNGGPLSGTGSYCAGIACCLMSREGAAPYRPKTRIGKNHPYLTQDGEDRESGPDQYIANMTDGAAAGFRYFRLNALQQITVTYRQTGTGVLKISGDPDEKPFAVLSLEPSREWTEASVQIEARSGVSSLWFRYEGTGSMDFAGFLLT